MKLYEINQEIENCIDQETGEIIDMDKLQQLSMEREQKIENIGCWIKNLESDIKALKAEEEAFYSRRKSAESKVKSLKDFLSYQLEGEAFKTAKVAITFRNSIKVNIVDLEKIPEEYIRITKTPSKTDIGKLLKSNIEVPGAVLETSKSISIK